jgi:hypothetical protein
MMGALHKDQSTFLIISRSLLLGMKNIVDKTYRENKTHILYSMIFFFENRTFVK